MIPWLYLLIGIICWPIVSMRIFAFFENDFGPQGVGPPEALGAAAIGLILSMIWPITAAAVCMAWFILRTRNRLHEIHRLHEEINQ